MGNIYLHDSHRNVFPHVLILYVLSWLNYKSISIHMTRIETFFLMPKMANFSIKKKKKKKNSQKWKLPKLPKFPKLPKMAKMANFSIKKKRKNSQKWELPKLTKLPKMANFSI